MNSSTGSQPWGDREVKLPLVVGLAEPVPYLLVRVGGRRATCTDKTMMVGFHEILVPQE